VLGTFGQGLTAAAPGSAEATLTVSDIVEARDQLVGRGIDPSEVWHGPPVPSRHGSQAGSPAESDTAEKPA
jgi:hypothetical protein